VNERILGRVLTNWLFACDSSSTNIYYLQPNFDAKHELIFNLKKQKGRFKYISNEIIMYKRSLGDLGSCKEY